MISLKNTKAVKDAIKNLADTAFLSAKQAAAECEAEIAARLYGDEYEASGGIEIGADLIKREFGSEDNPPLPIIENIIADSSSAMDYKLEEIFKRKMEED